MARNRQYLCVFYGLIALVALLATWSQTLVYFEGAHSLADGLGALGRFVTEARVTAAARSITLDGLLLSLAAMTFMVLEARRLGIRFVWLYIALGFLVAVSVTFPLFMIARERHLAWNEGRWADDGPAPLPLADGLGLAALCAAVVLLAGFVLGGGPRQDERQVTMVVQTGLNRLVP